MPLKLFSLTDRYSENKSQKIIVLMKVWLEVGT